MKVCPSCAFSNDDRFPTCVWCNRTLSDIPSTRSTDAAHPGREFEEISEKRSLLNWREARSASIFYALAIALTTAVASLTFDPLTLMLYGVSGSVVAGAGWRIGRLIRRAQLDGLASFAFCSGADVEHLDAEAEGHGKVNVSFLDMVMQAIGDEDDAHEQKEG